MISRHRDPLIELIWSEAGERMNWRRLWTEHRKHYGPEEKRAPERGVYPLTGHEVVDALTEFCVDEGDGDFHWGLTSSDVVDYSRLYNVESSNESVSNRLIDLNGRLSDFVEKGEKVKCVGYTHLLPAMETTVGHRFRPQLEALEYLKNLEPVTFFKPLAGPVGREAFPKNKIITGMEQGSCGQTTDGVTYTESACWLAGISRLMYKIAQDLRFMIFSGELSINSRIGSSSMTHKRNPTSLERCCSLAMRQPSFINEIWLATATSGLERTLTDSALLRNVLPEMYHNICCQIADLTTALPQCRIEKKKVRELLIKHKGSLSTYDQLIKDSKSQTRLDVYYKKKDL